MTLELVAVAAVARNGVIGAGDGLPWRIPSDLKRFKALTMGKPLILGRRTFQSLRRPLPGREIIVLTGNADFAPVGVKTAPTPAAALDLARQAAREMGAEEICIGGGAEVYRAFLDETARIELTEVALEPEGDTFFPALDLSQWRETRRENRHRSERDEADFAFVTLQRRRD